MKKYKFELTITEGYDEEWERLNDEGLSGCDHILGMVKEMLRDNPQFEADVKLIEFTDKE